MDPIASEQTEAQQQPLPTTSCSRSHSVRSQCSAQSFQRHSEDFAVPVDAQQLSPSLSPLSLTLSHSHSHPCSLHIPSAPPLSPPPPAIRIHDPHTLPTPQDDYTHFINAGCSSVINHDDDKWVSSPSEESTMPFSPQFLTQLESEKSGQHFLDTSSPSSATFHPIQPSVAPPISASLCHTKFPQNPNLPNSHAHASFTTASPLSGGQLIHGSSTTAGELEAQNNHSNHYHHPPTAISSSSSGGGAASHFNIQPLPSTSSAARRERREEMTGDDHLERTREEVNDRTRTNDVTSSADSTDRDDRAGSISPSSPSPANNRHRHPSNTNGSGSAPRRHVRINIDMPAEPEPPAGSRKRLPLLRQTLAFLRKPGKRYRRGSGESNRNHTVSRKEVNGRGSSRRNQTLRMIELARKVPYSGFNGPRKTGIPGRDGEEPETNTFKYVGIMLDMPENPTLWQVLWKLFKVLVVMTIAYFALMALYFAAEVIDVVDTQKL